MSTLYYATEDYGLLKIKMTALAAKAGIEFKQVDEAGLKEIDANAKSYVLQTSQGSITQHIAIIRYIAALSPSLVGSAEIDKAQVDQWLEFSWQDLEVPVRVILDAQATKSAPAAAAAKDVADNLAVLEDHASTRTFLVGEGLTAADISLFVTFLVALQLEVVSTTQFPSLYRWFMTVAVRGEWGNLFDLKTLISSKSLVKSSGGRVVAASKWDRHRIRVKELLKQGASAIGRTVVLKGWVRTARSAEKGLVFFVELTDGSTVKGIQLVLHAESTSGMKEVTESGGAGASLSITGTVVASPAKGQSIEIAVTAATVLGAVYGGDKGEIGGKNYPMAKKAHTLEFLREKAHLRPRSKVFSAAMRMRHAMAFATHNFFNERGFVYVHTPIVTAADCEGAGEQFVITTMLGEEATLKDIPVNKKTGHIDYSKDFFGRRCCLTVSGQLNVETHACALSDVYTFGPTFRAENSHTARHLAEFWMIEPEICFADLSDDMALAEDYVRYCTAYALEHCADDLHYFEHEYPQGEKGLRERLQNVADNEFARITYTEAVALLQEHIAAGKVEFGVYPNWGDDLGSEHERYITEKVYKKPTIVINYPKGIKAFYMKLNDDKETVAAMDILVPKIGELIGGSQREDDLATLERRVVECGMKPGDVWWYADLRRYGTVPHAGFGLGFERLVMFVTGLENIRDVIPFPRVPGHAEF